MRCPVKTGPEYFPSSINENATDGSSGAGTQSSEVIRNPHKNLDLKIRAGHCFDPPSFLRGTRAAATIPATSGGRQPGGFTTS